MKAGVSVRIARLLSERAFSFTPNEYLSIHKKLFAGIYSHAGKLRDYNITKKEWVLNGATAVFFIKYLRSLGFEATNEIFAENAWYFRNALVRANYNDLKNGIHETTEFLELFLRNLFLDEQNELHNRSMHISGMFKELPKQEIETKKQDIETEKQDIDSLNPYDLKMKNIKFSQKTLKHMQRLYSEFGNGTIFGRSDIMAVLGITASPTSELISKLLKIEAIVPVSGKGKGKYLFKLSLL